MFAFRRIRARRRKRQWEKFGFDGFSKGPPPPLHAGAESHVLTEEMLTAAFEDAAAMNSAKARFYFESDEAEAEYRRLLGIA